MPPQRGTAGRSRNGPKAHSVQVRGPRLTFTPFSEDSITAEYLAWLNDRELMRYSRQRFLTHTSASAREFMRSFERSDNYFWSIHRSDDFLQIGTLTMYGNAATGVSDFGILVGHPLARGMGFGREASGMAIAFLFDVARARRVTAGTLAPNLAMNRCCRYWGMALEGVLREHETAGLDPQVPVDAHLYGILRREWEALPHRLRVALQ